MLTWVVDLIRTFLSLFDRIVYWFIEILISLFDSLSKVQLFNSSNSGIFENFSNRLYFLIAIVMIFKVSFSIIQYIINPDSFSDKERGMGKVIQGIILSLVCLVGVRYIFEGAYNLQKAVLDSHIIEKVTLGLDNKGMTKTEQKKLKSQIPSQLLSSFIRPNTDVDGISFDGTTYSCSIGGNSFKMYENNVLQEMFFTQCFASLADKEQSTYSIINENGLKENVTGNAGKLYYTALKYNDYSILLDIINTKKDNDKTVFMFDYKFIVSTVAGVFVVIIYLNFCIDLAIRSVKFAFLQLIAPIPIISMVDPKSSKSGMMSKWVKNCINTYIGLFIRIFAVNFVIFVVNIVFNTKVIDSSEMDANIFAKVVILFGVLLFAKELPKLVSDLTGIDLSGNFKMNPLMRLPGGKFATKAATGTALASGALLGAGVGAIGRGVGGAVTAPLFQIPFLRNRYGGAMDHMRNIPGQMRDTLTAGAYRSLGHLRGILPRGHGSGEHKQTPNEAFREQNRMLREGEQLYNRFQNSGKDYTSIFHNKAFATKVQEVADAKSEMFKASDQYDMLNARYARGENVDQDQLMRAKKYKNETESFYKEKVNELKNYQGGNPHDWHRYEAFKKYKDTHEIPVDRTNVDQNGNSNSVANTGNVSNPSSVSNSSSSSGAPSTNSVASSSSSSSSSSPTRLRVTGLRNPREEERVRPSSPEGQIPVSNSGEMPGITPPSRNNGNGGNSGNNNP